MVMDLKAGLNENKFELKEFKDFSREWSRNDLIVFAAEILKWSVKLRFRETKGLHSARKSRVPTRCAYIITIQN